MKDPKTTCKTCTPQQTTELRCCICETTKGLQDFAKNQRKNPDVARCIECVQMHVGMEPGVDGPDCDSDVDSGDSDDVSLTFISSQYTILYMKYLCQGKNI
jgi:hypothetical protein